MSDNNGNADVLKGLLAQVMALDEIVCLLLAEHVQRTVDPMDSLRMLSDRLTRKLADAAGASIDDRLLVDIQREFDRIIATARDILG
ncbi:hypothetical protein [Methyloferula stellata]|uniref:hypothetical protein n=1 Tax=Methyloferula stellata TaxID=876270 RepID=UPI0003828F28|nr:hypothetical protein [Methyloferula stellata]